MFNSFGKFYEPTEYRLIQWLESEGVNMIDIAIPEFISEDVSNNSGIAIISPHSQYREVVSFDSIDFGDGAMTLKNIQRGIMNTLPSCHLGGASVYLDQRSDYSRLASSGKKLILKRFLRELVED